MDAASGVPGNPTKGGGAGAGISGATSDEGALVFSVKAEAEADEGAGDTAPGKAGITASLGNASGPLGVGSGADWGFIGADDVDAVDGTAAGTPGSGGKGEDVTVASDCTLDEAGVAAAVGREGTTGLLAAAEGKGDAGEGRDGVAAADGKGIADGREGTAGVVATAAGNTEPGEDFASAAECAELSEADAAGAGAEDSTGIVGNAGILEASGNFNSTMPPAAEGVAEAAGAGLGDGCAVCAFAGCKLSTTMVNKTAVEKNILVSIFMMLS